MSAALRRASAVSQSNLPLRISAPTTEMASGRKPHSRAIASAGAGIGASAGSPALSRSRARAASLPRRSSRCARAPAFSSTAWSRVVTSRPMPGPSRVNPSACTGCQTSSSTTRAARSAVSSLNRLRPCCQFSNEAELSPSRRASSACRTVTTASRPKESQKTPSGKRSRTCSSRTSAVASTVLPMPPMPSRPAFRALPVMPTVPPSPISSALVGAVSSGRATKLGGRSGTLCSRPSGRPVHCGARTGSAGRSPIGGISAAGRLNSRRSKTS
jgi:hypothetical protein